MRIVVGGRGWLAVRGARLIETMLAVTHRRATIEVVPVRSDPGRDTWLPSLARLATVKGWPSHEAPEAAALGKDDLFLSLQYDRVVACAALGGARAYNLHFADLPRYRGSLTSTVPIRHGAGTVGVTLHELVDRVDAGPIVAKRTFELPPFFTAFDLFRMYHGHAFQLFTEHLEQVLDGSCRAVAQDPAEATWFGRDHVDFSDVALHDFDHEPERVRDRCRSLIFPPAQYPTFHGRPVRSCYALRWRAGAGTAPGTVIAEDDEQAVVACRGGAVCLEYHEN
jgi:methionyl-tRNA formyltransferase